MVKESVIYWLDPSDAIRETNAFWDQFADENEGLELSSTQVLGKPIWKFIVGDTTRMWLDTLLSYARFHQKAVMRQYRCDSPETKRFMEMHILPEKNKNLCLEHRIVRTETMDPPVSYTASIKAIYFRCSICNKVQVKGHWYEGNEAVKKGLLPDSGAPRVAYRVCESCQNQVSVYARVPDGF